MERGTAASASAPQGVGRMESSVTPSMAGRMTMKKRAQKSIAGFFGLDEDEKSIARWERRRLTAAASFGKGVKESAAADTTDGPRNIVDPLHVSRQMSTQSTGTQASYQSRMRKKTVLGMTVSGLASIAAMRKDVRRKKSSALGQSFPPGSVKGAEERGDDFSLVDDVFYDEHPTQISSKMTSPPEAVPGGPSAPGWRRQPPQAIPSTPGPDQVDGFGLSRIKQAVMDSASNRDKRQMGMGVVGKLMDRRFRSSQITKDVKKQLDNVDDHRPYFTYWVTFVQIVVFIVAISVYGVAPIGISTSKKHSDVKMPNLAIQTETYIERENLWIGPRQADLIHLGAKYSPCMRVDANLQQAMSYDKAEESGSGCCIRNDGGGCRQSVKADCSPILSRWLKWDANDTGPGGRTSGAVCGQDPQYCNKPASSPPFEWPDEITEWPICTEKANVEQRKSSKTDGHMTCDILGRPCCFGIQGECIITTREHCDLKRGFFHDDAFLCSQVKCFEEICGMIPFANSEHPDQFYRLWTSLFLHGGVVHLVLSVLFQMLLMRDLEKLMGAIRIAIIYLGSGVAGNLASCTFIPYSVEVGPSGAQFGIAACLLVEVLQSYQMYRRPGLAVLKVVIPLLLFFVLGLLPWFDNWAHMFGFLFGFLLAFALMPYVSFGTFDRRRKLISIIICLGGSIGLFTLLVIIFYVVPITDCDWCEYLNCIPLTADFCENMQVNLKKNSTYSSFI